MSPIQSSAELIAEKRTKEDSSTDQEEDHDGYDADLSLDSEVENFFQGGDLVVEENEGGYEVSMGNSDESSSWSIISNCENERSLQSDLDQKDVIIKWRLGFRFMIAIYIWFREYCGSRTSRPDYIVSFDPDWSHVAVGIPSSILIVGWKFTDMLSYLNTNDKKDWCGLFPSMFAFIGSLVYLSTCIMLFFCRDFDVFKEMTGGKAVQGWIVGMGMMIASNVLESFIAFTELCERNHIQSGTILPGDTSRHGRGVAKAIIARICHPILQGAALIFLTLSCRGTISVPYVQVDSSSVLSQLSDIPEILHLYMSWSGLFFVWEGVILGGRKNAKIHLECWRLLFQILTSILFWTTSGDFYYRYPRDNDSVSIRVILLPPLLFLVASFTFDAQRIISTTTSQIAKVALFLYSSVMPGFMLISIFSRNQAFAIACSVLSLSAFIKWILVCWQRGGQPGYINMFKSSARILFKIAKMPYSFISIMVRGKRKDENMQVEKIRYQESIFHPYSEFFAFITFGTLLVQSMIISGNFAPFDDNLDFSLMLSNFTIGAFYFVHTVCWAKATYFRINEKNNEPKARKYILSEDTYTLMMYSEVFSQTWFLSLSVFVFQTFFLSLIVTTQWQQISNAGSFLDVPYSVTLPTSAGQVAIIILMVFFQRHHWVASSLFEISFSRTSYVFTRGGDCNEIIDVETEGLNVPKSPMLPNYICAQKTLSIFFPCLIRSIQSMGIVAATIVFVVQSDNIIELLTAYIVILFISEIDRFVYTLAIQGYIGRILQRDSIDAKDSSLYDLKEHPFRTFVSMTIFCFMMSLWIYTINNQQNGEFFKKEYQECFDKVGLKRLSLLDFKNGKCDEYLNFEECDFDGGDCVVKNLLWDVDNADSFGRTCGARWKSYLGNGRCDGGEYNTIECAWDNSDCKEFNSKYPECNVTNPFWIGDGVCDGDNAEYFHISCGYDGGDCAPKKYPLCTIYNPFADTRFKLGNGQCDLEFNTIECGWDGGDCI